MSFDKFIALECAELIRALYCNGIAPTINDEASDTQVLVRQGGKSAFVVFPGTDGLRDWETDFQAAKVDWYPGGATHAGFTNAANAVFDDVRKQISGADQIVVAGHSLGGALAMLTASGLMFEGLLIHSVYTFGQPRVGNGSFARNYNANLHDQTYRIENQDDPVPYLPPWLMGYRHAGTEVFLGDSSISIAPPWWEQGSKALDAVLDRKAMPDNKNFVSVSAHHITSYIKKLKG